MSAESKKNNYCGNLPLMICSKDRIPKDKIIKFNFNSLESKRRALAIRQIKIYEKKITSHPEMRSLYINLIKELIKYEKRKV